jgi:hypothetical protein
MDRSPHARPFEHRTGPSISEAWRYFSLWCPSPLQRVYCHLHLADDALELVTRRVVAVIAVAWLPLFIMSAIERRVSTGVRVPFLFDLDIQARILIALPLLIAGEVVVHRRMPIAVRQFVERKIIPAGGRPKFDEAVASALALSRSPWIELLLLIIVYTVGASLASSITSIPGVTWYGTPSDGAMTRTAAGWWYIAVSRPLFQFVLLRWYYRFLVWNRLLWQMSRVRLQLVPTHPDRRAGLGFVFGISDAFAPFLFAHGTIVAGRVANGVIHAGQTLQQSELELVTVPILALLFVLAPEFAFALMLWRVKRKGLGDYGRLAQRYVREFDHKWIHHPTPVFETLLGSSDIQSLADVANSYDTIRQLQVLPTRQSVMALLIMTVLPLAPLPLTVISGRELLERLVKVML